MANTVWPMILDMSQDECKRILRRLELDAYRSVISALRAQGSLSKDKHKLLQDLGTILNISVERHKGEIRRAVNDEKLATIAQHMAGPNTSTEWEIEGRRLIPLLPRLVPQTAFTQLANKMADLTAAQEENLPPPAETTRRKAPWEDSAASGSPIEHNQNDMCNNIQHLNHPSSAAPSLQSPTQSTSSSSSTSPLLRPPPPPRPLQRPKQFMQRPISQVSPPLTPPPPPMLHPKPRVPPPPPPLQPLPLQIPPMSTLQIPSLQPPPLQLLPKHQLPRNTSEEEMIQEQLQRVKRRRHSLSGDGIVGIVRQSHMSPPLRRSRLSPTSDMLQNTQELEHQEDEQQSTQSVPPSFKQRIVSTMPEQTSKSVQHSSTIVNYERDREQFHQSHHRVPTHQQQRSHPPSKFMQYPKQQLSQQVARLHPSQSSTVQQMFAVPKIQESASFSGSGLQTQPATHTRVLSGGSSNAPVKITFTPNRSALCTFGTSTTTTITTTTPASTTQKVIIVQSSGAASGPGPPSILQRSLSVPVMKSSPCTTRAPRFIAPGGGPPVTPSTIVTISTNPTHSNNLTATTVSIGGVPTTAYITAPGNMPRIRPKAVQLPSRIRPRAGSIVIPMTPNPLAGTSGLTGVAIKTSPLCGSRPTFHVRPETSNMKIMPVLGGSCGTAKILPKPPFGSGSSQSPVYMVNTSPSNITMVTRTIPATCPPPGSRMMPMNATTLPHPISSSQSRPMLVTKPASTVKASGCITAVKSSGRQMTTSKSNVIVVQKGGSYPKTITLPGNRMNNLQDVFSKVVASKGSISSSSTSTTTVTPVTGHKSHPTLHLPSTQTSSVVVLDFDQENMSKNQLLEEIVDDDDDDVSGDIDTLSDEHDKGQADAATVQQARSFTSHSTAQVIRNKSTTLHISRSAEPIEMAGELDPQTGVYSLHPEATSDIMARRSSVTIVPSSSMGSMDIFSTALATTNINLDSLQYMEEKLDGLPGIVQPSSSIEVTIGDGSQSVEESLQFLQESASGPSDPVAVTVEPSHIDTTGMHIEDYTSQKLQGQDSME